MFGHKLGKNRPPLRRLLAATFLAAAIVVPEVSAAYAAPTSSSSSEMPIVKLRSADRDHTNTWLTLAAATAFFITIKGPPGGTGGPPPCHP